MQIKVFRGRAWSSFLHGFGLTWEIRNAIDPYSQNSPPSSWLSHGSCPVTHGPFSIGPIIIIIGPSRSFVKFLRQGTRLVCLLKLCSQPLSLNDPEPEQRHPKETYAKYQPQEALPFSFLVLVSKVVFFLFSIYLLGWERPKLRFLFIFSAFCFVYLIVFLNPMQWQLGLVCRVENTLFFFSHSFSAYEAAYTQSSPIALLTCFPGNTLHFSFLFSLKEINIIFLQHTYH